MLAGMMSGEDLAKMLGDMQGDAQEAKPSMTELQKVAHLKEWFAKLTEKPVETFKPGDMVRFRVGAYSGENVFSTDPVLFVGYLDDLDGDVTGHKRQRPPMASIGNGSSGMAQYADCIFAAITPSGDVSRFVEDSHNFTLAEE